MDVENVMQDLVAIRRSISSYQGARAHQIGDISFRAKVWMQGIALTLLTILISIEWIGHNIITRNLLMGAELRQGQFLILASVGAFLAVCVGTAYFIVARAATRAQEGLNQYIKRNFLYLENLSHITDLGIKFAVVAALVIGHRPEWVAPFLFLFTGDYLIQGRFFTLTVRMSQILGLLSLVEGAAMFWLGNPQVIWPLSWFFIVTAISVHHLTRLKRVEE